MKLIDKLKDSVKPFIRTIWYSAEARDYWESKLKKARTLAHELEYQSVVHGLREANVAHVHHSRAKESVKKFLEDGLFWLPIRKTGIAGGFLHSHPEPEGNRWQYYGTVSRSREGALAFLEASEKGDHDKIGELLGYPKKSRDFFNKVWPKYYDPIWQIDGEVLEKEETEKGFRKTIMASPYANPALRYIGVKWVFHFPSSYSEPESIEYGKNFRDLAFKIDPESAKWLDELSRMPFSWDCCKGVAEINTPIFKTVVNSINCYPHYEIFFKNENMFWPRYGLEKDFFPFNMKGECSNE